MSSTDELIDDLAASTPVTEPVTPEPVDDGAWKTDKSGRRYIPKPPGEKGVIFQRGEETPGEARERNAQGGGDKRPRRRRKPPTPSPPKGLDLRELEALLAEAFKSPAMVAGMFGDEWLANHFVDKGPYLARSLVKASETNPWLRRKLEEMAAGGDVAVQFIGVLSLAGAVIFYAVPPVLYLTGAGAPTVRAMLEVPDRAPAPEPMPHTYYPEPPVDATTPESTESPVDIPLE